MTTFRAIANPFVCPYQIRTPLSAGMIISVTLDTAPLDYMSVILQKVTGFNFTTFDSTNPWASDPWDGYGSNISFTHASTYTKTPPNAVKDTSGVTKVLAVSALSELSSVANPLVTTSSSVLPGSPVNEQIRQIFQSRMKASFWLSEYSATSDQNITVDIASDGLLGELGLMKSRTSGPLVLNPIVGSFSGFNTNSLNVRLTQAVTTAVANTAIMIYVVVVSKPFVSSLPTFVAASDSGIFLSDTENFPVVSDNSGGSPVNRLMGRVFMPGRMAVGTFDISSSGGTKPFKFPRNPLEDAFEQLKILGDRVDKYINRKETTLPFRDHTNMPPGVEGQVVLAEYTPASFLVYSGDTAFPELSVSPPVNQSWFQIYRCNASGVETRINPNHRENQSIPALSHDYTKVTYMAADKYNSLEDGTGGFPFSAEHLQVCNIDGTGLVTLDTWGSSTTDTSTPQILVWSPDGTKVAAHNHSGFWIYPVNGDPRVVVSTSIWDYSPVSWSHDSQYVFYNSTNNSIVRRKWDASDSEVVFMDGTVYHDSATFMMHPHDSILVFNYFETGASDPDDNRALGFLNVAEPGHAPEFITWGDLVAAGIWHTPYGTVEHQYLTNPQWSPDGNYILCASEESRTITATPHYRTWIYYMFSRDLTDTASSSLFNTAGTDALITDLNGDGYRSQYPPTWVNFSSTPCVVGEEQDFDIAYSQYPFPSGPLTPLVRTDPAGASGPGPPATGYVWFRQLGSGTWYPSWSQDFESKYYS